ncbi:MAG TPA: hypothetical protein VJW76_03155, partial [Verrucomicrobiae bacterium]|nr:hypothetical protein [Verrucomicrobiae bacterium]
MTSRFVYPIFLACLAATNTHSQVRSLTLGIDVNSPYGIGEPWVIVREGLQRLEIVESMAPQPDKAAGTGELRPRDGQLPDLDMLAKALRDTGAGARLRGVEGTIDGELAREENDFVLRISGTKTVLRLRPLTQLVQRNRQPTDDEKAAFQTLAAKWKGRPLQVRVVGPLIKSVESKDT